MKQFYFINWCRIALKGMPSTSWKHRFCGDAVNNDVTNWISSGVYNHVKKLNLCLEIADDNHDLLSLVTSIKFW